MPTKLVMMCLVLLAPGLAAEGLRVLSTVPIHGMAKVSIDTTITMTFSGAPTNTNPESFVSIRASASGNRQFTLSASGATWTLTLPPLADGHAFLSNEEVLVTVTPGLSDGALDPMSYTHKLMFHTVDAVSDQMRVLSTSPIDRDSLVDKDAYIDVMFNYPPPSVVRQSTTQPGFFASSITGDQSGARSPARITLVAAPGEFEWKRGARIWMDPLTNNLGSRFIPGERVTVTITADATAIPESVLVGVNPVTGALIYEHPQLSQPYTFSFLVDDMRPARGTSLVDVDTAITFSFFAAPTSVLTDFVSVQGSLSGRRAVSIVPSGAALSLTVDTLAHGHKFFANEEVAVTVKGGVADAGGSLLGASRTLTFRTRALGGDADFNLEAAINLGGSSSGKCAVADFNGDGKLDIASVASTTDSGQFIRVNLNNGVDGFELHASFGDGHASASSPGPAVTVVPTGIAVGDLNRDGHIDVVVAYRELDNSNTAAPLHLPHRCVAFLNDGHANFSDSSVSVVGSGTSNGLALGDMNGDGALDVVLANGYGSDQACGVWLNDGTGGFANDAARHTTFASSAQTDMLCLLDMNHDGHLDVAVRHSQCFEGTQTRYGRIHFFLNDGQGTLAGESYFSYPDGANPTSISGQHRSFAFDDVFSGDGRPELIPSFKLTTGQTSSRYLRTQLHVREVWGIQDPDGTIIGTTSFDGPMTVKDHGTSSSTGYPVTGDFNNDGRLDIYVAVTNGQSQVCLQGASITNWTSRTVGTSNTGGVHPIAADMDGDGDLDVVEPSSNGLLVRFNGTSTLAVNSDPTTRLEAVSGFSPPTTIDSIGGSTTPVEVFRFRVHDTGQNAEGGAGDGKPTVITRLDFTESGDAKTSSDEWTLSSPGMADIVVQGTPSFTGLNITIDNGQSREFSLRLKLAAFKSNNGRLVDGEKYVLVLPVTNISVGAGSRLDSASSTLSYGQGITYAVLATKLELAGTVAARVVAGQALEELLFVSYRDANGNLDNVSGDTIEVFRSDTPGTAIHSSSPIGGRIQFRLTLSEPGASNLFLIFRDNSGGSVDLSASPVQSNHFELAGQATVTGLDPATTSGHSTGGDIVRIYGTEMHLVTGVGFGLTGSTVTDGTDLQLLDATTVSVRCPKIPSGVVDPKEPTVNVVVYMGNRDFILEDAFTYIPAADVRDFSPRKGSSKGGSHMTLTGVNLDLLGEVEFPGGTIVTHTQFVSTTKTSVILPVPPGTTGDHSQLVFRDQGADYESQSAEDMEFTYLAPIYVDRQSRYSGYSIGGEEIIVEGGGFSDITSVTFVEGSLAIPATFGMDSESQLTITTPAVTLPVGTDPRVGYTLNIVIRDAQGNQNPSVANGFSHALDFRFFETPPLAVTSLSPKSGYAWGGQRVSVRGRGLSGVDEAWLDFPQGTLKDLKITQLQHISDTELVLIMPASYTINETAALRLWDNTAGRNEVRYATWTYTPNPSLGITGISSYQGYASGGNPITITSPSASIVNRIQFGEAEIPASEFLRPSDTEITFALPPMAEAAPTATIGTGTTITITIYDTLDRSAEARPSFTYITNFDPTTFGPRSAVINQSADVSIIGSGLMSMTEVRFGATVIEATAFKSQSDKLVVVTAPLHQGAATSVPLAVSDGINPPIELGQFAYTDPEPLHPPELHSLGANNRGPLAGGTIVILKGAYLAQTTSVSFGTSPATINTRSFDSIVVSTGAHDVAEVVDVTVTTPDGTDTLVAAFTYGQIGGNDNTPTPQDPVLPDVLTAMCSLEAQGGLGGLWFVVLLGLAGLLARARRHGRKNAAAQG